MLCTVVGAEFSSIKLCFRLFKHAILQGENEVK